MAEVRNVEKGRMIRVVVGDDSPLIQALIVAILEHDPEIKVVGKGADGQAVLKLVADLRPDCVTLDLEMPRMDGLETLRYIMSEWPTPVVIVSAHTAEGAKLTFTCLEYGAIDFVTKAGCGSRFSPEELIGKVRAAAAVDVTRKRFVHSEIAVGPKPRIALAPSLRGAVILGASTGGPQAFMEIVPRLPRDIPASVVLVQHMPPNFTRYLAERLDARSSLDVREAIEGDALLPGKALVAPGGMHLFLEERDGRPALMLLGKNSLQRSVCPSIDYAMSSFAPIFRERLIGVVLTGMGRDGVAGAAAIRRYGGTVICQDKESSLIYGMPGAVVGAGLADMVCPLEAIGNCIASLMEKMKAVEPIHV